MGLKERFEAAWQELIKIERPPNEQRHLTEDDLAGWSDALDSREKAIKPRTVQDVRILVRKVNFVRWHRLQKDFAWLQKEMKKMDLNPEDARYIL